MLRDIYKSAEQTQLILILDQDCKRKELSDFERGLIVEAWMAGAAVTKTEQLAGVSTETMTKVTSAFRSWGQQRPSDDRDACALARFVRKNRRATLPQDRLRMSVQDGIRLRQQEQSIYNYIQRYIIVGLQCMNPSLQRWMYI